MKEILWKFLLDWRISDPFNIEFGQQQKKLEKWFKNLDVTGHLEATGLHLILFTRRKISDGDRNVLKCCYFYRTKV